MLLDLPRGNVLVLAEDRERGERLARWISAAGERPVPLAGAEKFLVGEGEEESVDLVVTDLDTDDGASRRLLERLASGRLFPGIPAIHLLRNPASRETLRGVNPTAAAAALPSTSEAGEFQARVRLAAEVGRLRRRVGESSIQDPMTCVANRAYLLLRLEEEFSRSRRHRTPLSVIYVDLDHLKAINDRFGQNAGDQVIRRVCGLMRARVRKEDILGRMGGGTFAILLPGNRCRGAANLANQIRTEAEETDFEFAGSLARVRVSAGISSHPDNDTITAAEDLVRCAEDALAEAKTRGGNRVFIDELALQGEQPLVVVADRDPALLDLAEDLLTLDGFRVVRAQDAATVLEAIRFRRPDLLVVDLHLRDPSGARALVERIVEMFPEGRFPVIGLLRSTDLDPRRLARMTVDRYITKPFSVSVLRSIARELLDTEGVSP